MRFPKIAAAALGAAVLAVPVAAAVKAMTLKELMGITTDTALVHIVDKTTFRSDWPDSGMVWTKMTVQGESLRTGEPVQTDVYFLGSHDPKDAYGTSEMPTLQDTRVGADAVVFWTHDPDSPGQMNRIGGLAGVYRVEKGFGEPVVMGKGEGFAFPDNIKVTDARALVLKTHLELQAAQPGDKK
jgi:hypothetical protein